MSNKKSFFILERLVGFFIFLAISVYSGLGFLYLNGTTTFNIVFGMAMSTVVMVLLISQDQTIKIYKNKLNENMVLLISQDQTIRIYKNKLNEKNINKKRR